MIIFNDDKNKYPLSYFAKETFSLVVAEYLFYHQIYREIEDAFNCSGMFKPALFYFSKDLHEGPPTETCIVHFKELISS